MARVADDERASGGLDDVGGDDVEVECFPEVPTVSLEDVEFVVAEWPELVGEAEAAVELGVG